MEGYFICVYEKDTGNYIKTIDIADDGRGRAIADDIVRVQREKGYVCSIWKAFRIEPVG